MASKIVILKIYKNLYRNQPLQKAQVIKNPKISSIDRVENFINFERFIKTYKSRKAAFIKPTAQYSARNVTPSSSKSVAKSKNALIISYNL